MLNGKVFFWPTKDRLLDMLDAYQYESRLVLVVESEKLLEKYEKDVKKGEEKVKLSRINSGDTSRPNSPPRGNSTFRPLADWPANVTEKNAIAEVTVEYAVLDIVEMLREGDGVKKFRAGEQVVAASL